MDRYDNPDSQTIDAEALASLRVAETQPRRGVYTLPPAPIEGLPPWTHREPEGVFVPLDAAPLGNLGLPRPSILTGDDWVAITVGMYLSQTRGVGPVPEEIVKVTSVTRFGWRGAVVASADPDDLNAEVRVSRCDCFGWRVKHLISDLEPVVRDFARSPEKEDS